MSANGCGCAGIATPTCALELIHHPAERRMAPVLHLDPAVKPAATVGAVPMLRHQPLQAHQAGVPKQVRPDLALFERREMDAVDAPRGYQAELSAGEAGDCLRSYLHCCRKLRTASPEPRAGTAIGAGSPSKTILISFCALPIMDINLTDPMNV